jgi:hypothetical protein
MINHERVEFQILTAVVMKSSVFWDIPEDRPLLSHGRDRLGSIINMQIIK